MKIKPIRRPRRRCGAAGALFARAQCVVERESERVGKREERLPRERGAARCVIFSSTEDERCEYSILKRFRLVPVMISAFCRYDVCAINLDKEPRLVAPAQPIKFSKHI